MYMCASLVPRLSAGDKATCVHVHVHVVCEQLQCGSDCVCTYGHVVCCVLSIYQLFLCVCLYICMCVSLSHPTVRGHRYVCCHGHCKVGRVFKMSGLC